MGKEPAGPRGAKVVPEDEVAQVSAFSELPLSLPLSSLSLFHFLKI